MLTGKVHLSCYHQRACMSELQQPFRHILTEINERFETGRRLLNSSYGRLAFLRSGRSDAFFRLAGTTLTILVMIGKRFDRHSLKTVAGTGSRSHDLRTVLPIRFPICVVVIGVK